ncbi:MAG TPA: NADPH-dependent F420 reductase [Candidatus Acidoferrales bacterium]|nr:NADPH-dependent F420 reductase [Candidatus Acidoferrales bacterium]
MDAGTVTVIGGTGDQGMGLALRWAAAGRRVVIGSRDAARAAAAAQEVRQRAGAASQVEGRINPEAAALAPLVVLAVPFNAQIATLKSIAPALRPGQVLVDLTVPVEATVGGSPVRMLGVWAGSAAEQAAENVPEGVEVAAAFHNVSAHGLRQLEAAVDCDVLVCADRKEIRDGLRPWVEAIQGCRYVDGGRLENARIVEAITALLIGINRRHKIHAAGIRITGLVEQSR